jgi:hypothetical protein
MSDPTPCPQEPLLLASIGDVVSESVTRHLESCTSCREAKDLAESLRQLAARHIAAPPPDPDVLWVVAQLSKPHSLWTPESIRSIAALAAVALLSVWFWPTISGYLSGMLPKSAPTANLFLTSCVVAAAIAGVAAKTIRRLTGE